jgi:putative drug exporter of the RND superfamily
MDLASRSRPNCRWSSIVSSLSFGLLTFVFRSVLVPLKAVIVNLLSVGAAFGVLFTYAFGHHWSATALGLQRFIPIASFVPLLMFGILLGSSRWITGGS